jgi:hypothetical protein
VQPIRVGAVAFAWSEAAARVSAYEASVACASDAPHAGQSSSSAGACVPHSGHAIWSGTLHEGQRSSSRATTAPQFAHVIVPASGSTLIAPSLPKRGARKRRRPRNAPEST